MKQRTMGDNMRSYVVSLTTILFLMLLLVEEGTPAPNVAKKACRVKDINVQKNFDLKRFQGVWYDFARVELARDAIVLSSGVSEYTLQPDGELRIQYGGETNGRCIRPLLASGQQNSTNSAKLTVNVDDMPDFFLRGAFWVIETNYDHAVIYSCYKLRPDGTCDPSEELAYILSRKRTLPDNISQRVALIARTRLCIDLTRLKRTEYSFPCPPDPRYEPQKYLEKILTENNLDVTTTDDSYSVSLIEPSLTSAVDLSSTDALLSTERSLTNDEPVSFVDEPSNITSILSEEQEATTVVTAEDVTGFTEEGIDPTVEESVENSTATSPSETLTDLLDTPPMPGEINTTATTLSKTCHLSDIPTQNDFEIERFLGQWFLMASYSSLSFIVDSATAVLSKSRGDVINTAFTGYSGGQCLGTVRGYLRASVEDPATLHANYATMSGPFKIVYINENYTSALVYQCNRSSVIDGVCQSVAVDVLSRARRMSADDMKDVLRHVGEVCLESSDFVTIKHEAQCEVEPLPESGPSCKVQNFQVQQDIDWSRFAGKWYTVSRLKRRFGFESGTWVISERINGNISAAYVAARHDNCLPPVRPIWTPAIDRSGNFLVSYDGVTRLGKIVFTDYQVALYYECDQLESDGSCGASNVRLEVWQRSTDAMGNILLRFALIIRDLCINPVRLQVVSHDVRCDVPPQCSMPEAMLLRDDMRTELVRKGRWTPRFLFTSEESSGTKQLNEMMFSTVGSNGTVVVCLTTTNHENVCQSTECVTVESLFGSSYQRFTMDDDGRSGHATTWRPVLFNDLYLVLYVCHKVVDGRGRGGVCDPSAGRLYVLGPGESVLGDSLPARLQSALDKMCLSRENKLNITVSCPVEVPPYSKVIDTLPVFESVNVPQMIGIWYSIQVTGYKTVSKISKLRLSLEPSGKVDIVFANIINGTCQPSKRYLATKVDDRGADWLILTFNRQSGHLRILYMDQDIAVVYFCQRLQSQGICYPNESLVLLMSKAPVLTEERRGTIRENLRAHQYDSIDDVITKAGFRNDVGSNISFTGAVACSVPIDENLCPIESLPVVKKLHFNKFLGHWYVVSRLQNSPSFDTAELRFSPGEETSIVYTGTKNGRCQRPLRGKLVPLPDGLDSQFEVDYGNGHVGRFQVIFTNYRSALVYQCLQVLSDGACLPGQVVVELLSRTVDMNPRLKVPLLKRTQDLCVNQDDMTDTTYNNECREEASSSCYVDDFPKDVTFTNADFLGNWYVSHIAKRIRGFEFPSSIRILSDGDPNRFRYISQFTRDGNCYSIESHLVVLSSDAPYHMAFDFKENNALLRVIEAGYGMMLAYVCKYLESDGRCQPDFGGVLVLSRSLNDVPEEMLLHYTDLFPELCLESTDELVRVSPSDCKLVESVRLERDCDIKSADIRPQYASQMVDVEWHLAGRLRGGLARPSGIKYHISRHSKLGQLIVHFTAAKEGNCLPTTKVMATLSREGSYDVMYNNEHVEFFIIFADAELSIIYSCHSYDSFGRCDPQKIAVELFTRNASLPDLAKAKLYEIELSWCFRPENFIPISSDGLDCPLLIEPECSIDVPPSRSTIDLDKVGGYWYALATQSGRNLPRISAIDIEMSADQQTMTTFISSSQNGRCLPTFKTTVVNASPNNFRWRLQSIGLTGYLLLVYVDDDFLVLLECLSSELCTPDSVSSIDLYSRRRSPLDDVDKRTLAKVFRRICYDIDNFTFLLSDVECVVEEKHSLSQCSLDPRGRSSHVIMPQLTGTWYAGAKLKRSEVAESEVVRITGHELTSVPSYTATFTGSRRGQCLSSVRGRLLSQSDENEGSIKIVYEDSSTAEWAILFTDYRYLVTMECRDLKVNDSCRADNAIIAMYTREPVDISSIIGELIRVVGLDDCLRAHDFISISHEVPCYIVSPSCILLPHLPLRDNFSMDGLLGVWHSLYHLRSLSALDSYTIRFHRDDGSGMVIGYFTGSYNRECQPAVSFSVPNDNREWTMAIGDKQARMKVLAVDESHVILYRCLDYDTSQGTCRADATHVNVLSHDSSEDLSPSVITWAADAVHQACIEFGDMDHTHHSISCPLPIVKRTGCKWDRMPVASNIDYNKLGGVWYSYLLLKGSAVDFSTTILQWSRGTSYAAIFRSSRKDECLAVQTGVVVPRADDASKADFDAKFRTYSAKFRVLYTDYSYALIYTCTADLDNGQCPPVHRQVSINGRLKTGQLPSDVREKIFTIASDACLYEEDFVEATHYAECDLPYSGRQSCRVDDVITHDAFDLREMFGNWQLLSRTTNMNSTRVAESIRFSPGVGGIIKYIVSGEDSLGLCQRVDGTIESVANQNTTFTFSENGGDTHLMKILFMNSQYLISYVCHGPLPADLEVCDENREEVKVYGRTNVMSATVRKMLTDIVWQRICLSLSQMIDVKYNNKCDLPSGCDIQDFILQENFEPHMVSGTWQVLVRSSFRQSSTLPSTAKFFQTLTSAINMVRVVNQSDEYCHSENLLLRPTDGPAGVYQTQPDAGTASSMTLFLYVMDRYFVTLDCIGALSSEGDCTAEKVELTIWGRTWDLSSSLRRTLLQEIRDRTLRCYAIHAMVDVQANENCELPSSACDMNQYMLEKDFDGRLMLGQWHLLARSPLYSTSLRIGDMRVALSGHTYHVIVAGKHNGGDCFEMSASMRFVPGMNSTLLLTSDNIQSLTQIVYWSEDYLVRVDCMGMSSPVTYCHPERTGVQVLSRSGYMDEDTMSHLIRVTRERTQSCVATSGLEAVPFAENICPNSAPLEGSESCSFDGIRLGHKLNLQQLNGIWFQVMRTNRVREFHWDGGIYHFNVKNKTVTLIYAGHPSFKRNGHCFVESTEATFSEIDNTEWQTVMYGHNDTMKIIDIGDDHLITYECFDNQFTSQRYCRPEFEHLEVFHRRRHINNQHLQQLLDIISRKTCFSRAELIRANHSRKCEIPGILDLDYLKGKPCDVETYPAISDFETERFVGIWHEVERTRYSHGILWESGIFNFSLDASGSLGFLYSGTKSDQCLGPIEGHSRPVQGDVRSSDLIVWIGPQEQSHHPWTVHYRFKIVYTDYENAAVIYSCHSTTDDGICHRTSEQVFVLSRSHNMEAVTRGTVYYAIRDSICVDVHDLVKVGYEANCRDFVDGSHEEIKRLVRERYILQRRPTVEPEEPSTTIPQPTLHICPMVLCANRCPNGYTTDENGCGTCTCEPTEDLTTSDTTDVDLVESQITYPPANVEKGYESTNSPVECAIPMCLNFCEHGYALDERGCETCNCSPAPPEPRGENYFDLDNSVLDEGEVTAVTTVRDDTVTEAHETGVPTETSIQETPKDTNPLSEVEGTVEEIDLPDVHPVFPELRKTRTADTMGPDADQFHSQDSELNAEQGSNQQNVENTNKTHELSTDASTEPSATELNVTEPNVTEPNATEPANKADPKDMDQGSDESKNKEQDKASLESMEPDVDVVPDDNSNLTKEPDGSELNTAEPELQDKGEDDVWTGLMKYFDP